MQSTLAFCSWSAGRPPASGSSGQQQLYDQGLDARVAQRVATAYVQ